MENKFFNRNKKSISTNSFFEKRLPKAFPNSLFWRFKPETAEFREFASYQESTIYFDTFPKIFPVQYVFDIFCPKLTTLGKRRFSRNMSHYEKRLHTAFSNSFNTFLTFSVLNWWLWDNSLLWFQFPIPYFGILNPKLPFFYKCSLKCSN